MIKYRPDKVISAGQVVKYNGKLFKALRDSVGKTPTVDGFFWSEFTEEEEDKPLPFPKDEEEDKPIVLPKDDEEEKPIVLPDFSAPPVIDKHIVARARPGRDGTHGKSGRDGRDGEDGKDGVGLDFKWEGTKLGIKKEDEDTYKFVELALSTPTTTLHATGGASQRFRLYNSLAGESLIKAAKPHVATLKDLIAGTNVTFTVADDSITINSSGGGGGSGHTIQDEGSPLTARANLNFVGSTVAVTDDAGNNASVVTITAENPLTFSTGLTRTVDTITVNTTQNITRLSNLTSNGFVKTTLGNGTLSIDTNTYLTQSTGDLLYIQLDGGTTTTATIPFGGFGLTTDFIAFDAGLNNGIVQNTPNQDIQFNINGAQAFKLDISTGHQSNFDLLFPSAKGIKLGSLTVPTSSIIDSGAGLVIDSRLSGTAATIFTYNIQVSPAQNVFSQFGQTGTSTMFAPSDTVDRLVSWKSDTETTAVVRRAGLFLCEFTGGSNTAAQWTGFTAAALTPASSAGNITSTTNGGGLKGSRVIAAHDGSGTVTLATANAFRVQGTNITTAQNLFLQTPSVTAGSTWATYRHAHFEFASTTTRITDGYGIYMDSVNAAFATNGFQQFMAGTGARNGIYFNQSTEFLRSDTASSIMLSGNTNVKLAIGGTAVATASTGLLTVTALTSTGLATVSRAVGDTLLTLTSTATNDDPTENTIQNRTTTGNGTPTTIATIAIPATTTVMVEARVVARRTGGLGGTAEDGAAYQIFAVFKNVAGTATQIGATAQPFVAEDQAGWDATFAVSGGNALIQVTGAATNNITWHVTYRTYAVST